MKKSALALVLFFFCQSSFAFNHPEIQWRSVSTQHFIINYYDKTEPTVYATWKIAEESYETLSEIYGYKTDKKIPISLADLDDYSNGYADWLGGSIMIFVPDARMDFRSQNTWLRNVITHELTHIVTLDKQRKLQVVDWALVLNYESPVGSARFVDPFERMTMFPNWFAEGLAQAGSQKLGNDCWDSRRDMLLRCSVLGNTQLTLGEMGYFNHDSRGNEQVYNQGFSFVNYLETVYGRSKIARIISDANEKTVDFPSFFNFVTGSSLDTLYHSWLDSLQKTFKARISQNPTQTQNVWDKGYHNAMPRISLDGTYWGWLTNDKDDYDRTDLIIAKSGSSKPIARILYAQTSWDFSSDGKFVYYIKARDANENGSYLNDVFSFDLSTHTEKQVTKNARTYDIACSSDGKSMALVCFKSGVFSLFSYSFETKRVKEIFSGELGNALMAPSYNPQNSQQLVFTQIIKGISRLAVLDLESNELNFLTEANAQEESPFWANDGKIYYDADYDGIFNIYSILPDGSEQKKESTCIGGMFSPVVDKNGQIVCSEYSTRGFTIVKLQPEDAEFELPESFSCTFDSLPKPKGAVKINSVPYEPKYLKSTWEIQTNGSYMQFGPDSTKKLTDSGTVDTIVYKPYDVADVVFIMDMARSDALAKKSVQFGVAADIQLKIANNPEYDTLRGLTHLSSIVSQRMDASFYHANTQQGLSPENYKKEYCRAFLRNSFEPLEHNLKYPALGVAGNSGATNDSSAAKQLSGMLFLQPYLSYENAMFAPTFGLQLTLQTALVFVPLEVDANPYIQWQLSRDLDFAITPQILYEFLSGGYSVTVPLQLQWLNTGYTDVNINYTLRDVTLLFGGISPTFFPISTITGITQQGLTNYDTTVSSGMGLILFFSGFRGFPIGQSGSFVLGGDYQSYLFNEKLMLSGIKQDSAYSHIMMADVSGKFVFPVFKKINAGTSHYIDALYGVLSYKAALTANQYFLNHANGPTWGNVLTKPDANGNAIVGHTIGIGLQSELFKSYMFSGTSSLEVSYEMLYNKLFVNLIVDF